MLKTRTWILCFLLAALVLGILSWFLLARRETGDRQVVEILQGNRVLREIDLGRVQAPERFILEGPEGGSNTVEVEPGRIRIAEADCPDQICVRQGWLDGENVQPLICLPHQLVIRLKNAEALDAVVR